MLKNVPEGMNGTPFRSVGDFGFIDQRSILSQQTGTLVC